MIKIETDNKGREIKLESTTRYNGAKTTKVWVDGDYRGEVYKPEASQRPSACNSSWPWVYSVATRGVGYLVARTRTDALRRLTW